MKRIVCLFIAFLALTLVSCSTYQTKREIKKYEENTRNEKVYSIDLKQFKDTHLYVAKIRYKHEYYIKTEPVFRVFYLDDDDILEMDKDGCHVDCIANKTYSMFDIIEYCFPEALDVDDYVIIKGYWMWKQYGIKVDIDIDYYINEIRNERDKRK